MTNDRPRFARVAGLSFQLMVLGLVLAACSIVQSPEVELNTTAVEYNAEPLPLLPNTRSGHARFVSDDGQIIVGTVGGKAVVWNAEDELLELEGGDIHTPEVLSGDGSVLVGQKTDFNSETPQVVRWDTATGQSSVLDAGSRFTLFTVSDDGSVIVGRHDTGSVVWDAAGDATVLQGTNSSARVSGDGRVIAGSAYDSAAQRRRAAIWNSAGELSWLTGTLGEGFSEGVQLLSADGSVLIGTSTKTTGEWPDIVNERYLVAWNTAGEIRTIDDISGDLYEYYTVEFASADGSVTGGEYIRQGGCCDYPSPIRWSATGETAFMPGVEDSLIDISRDGSIFLAQEADPYAPNRAKVWDTAGNVTILEGLSEGSNQSYAYATNVDGSVIVGYSHNSAGEPVPVRWVRQEVADTYTMTFDNLPLNRVISSVSLGEGIVSDTGTSQDAVSVQAERKGLRGNVAVVTGTNPALIISKNGRSGASFPQGGTINLDFNAFEDGLIDLESLRISGTTRPGTVAVYRDGVRLSSVALPNTGTSGSQTVSLNVSDADRLTVTLTGPGRIDDIVFTN